MSIVLSLKKKEINSFINVFSQRGRSVDKHYCRTCLSSFRTQKIAENNMNECAIPQTILYPPPGSQMLFKNWDNGYSPSHLCIYDFEACMESSDGHGRLISLHIAMSYCYLIINRSGEISKSRVYSGSDTATNFVESLSAEWGNIYTTMPYYSLSMSEAKIAF